MSEILPSLVVGDSLGTEEGERTFGETEPHLRELFGVGFDVAERYVVWE